MKTTDSTRNRGRRGLLAAALGLISVCLTSVGAYGQNSLPAPGSGGSYNPAPIGGGGGMGPGPGFGPGPSGPGWGPGWNGPGWNGPGIVTATPSYMNQGTANVVAIGYDNTGVMRTIPMYVAYYYNYGEYDVTVLAAYNPFTMMWNRGLNVPAYNTTYYLRGNTYDFYVPLSTGTYYFNL